jgi:tetratricopeptide (TPR) repeat protein
MRLPDQSVLRAPLFVIPALALLAWPALVLAWQTPKGRPVVKAGGLPPEEPPRVLSPQAAQPISRDAAQRSEPATVVIEDSPPPASTTSSTPPASSVRMSKPPAGSKPAPETAARLKPADPVVEAAKLKGIQPGSSTMTQVRASWGEPTRVDRFPQHIEHRYALEPFKQVIVAFRGETVHSIVVELQASLETGMVQTQLGLGELEPALVYDQAGKLLGQVFPERGVLFSFEPGAKELLVTQIVLEGIQPQPFAIRAESRLATHWTQGLKDAEQALKLDPQFARAHWLNAQLLAAAGRNEEALTAAEEAVKLDNANPEYRLTRARLYHAHGDTAQAAGEARAALAQAATPLVKARGLLLLGDLATAERRHEEAVEHRQAAIEVLEPLLAHSRGAQAAAVREAFLDAHLGTAHDIAWGDWASKREVVSKWLEEARSIAQEDKPSPETASERQLRMARAVLGALAGLQGEVDPTSWFEALDKSTQEALGTTEDPLRCGQLQWELALGCYNAMQSYHARGDGQRALRCGVKGVEGLSKSAAQRGQTSDHLALLGQLYFRTGAVHAVINSSHSQAITWYDRALPLIKQAPASTGSEAGRQGESLVSMAVSYWEVGQRTKALELTTQGLSQMQTAVEQGLLEETALSVPYSNLAQMHRRLGDAQAAGKFAQLASRSQGALK